VRLTKIVLILALVVGTAFAQNVKQSKRSEAKMSESSLNTSRAYEYDVLNIDGYLDQKSMVSVILTDDQDATPVVLNRSFKDALKENSDRETIERLVR